MSCHNKCVSDLIKPNQFYLKDTCLCFTAAIAGQKRKNIQLSFSLIHTDLIVRHSQEELNFAEGEIHVVEFEISKQDNEEDKANSTTRHAHVNTTATREG